jgi:hypothetical protein
MLSKVQHMVKGSSIYPEDGNHSVNKPATLKVMSIPEAFLRLTSADWLTKNDQSETNAKKNFTEENVNLSLVCALLFTSFLPIFYTESASMNDPTQGLALDIERSWLNQMNYQYLSTAFLHDMFLFFYAFALGNACLGTLISVFYTLSAAQCDSDNKCVVVMNILGFFSRLPYLFFATGIVMWGFTAYLKIILTAQTVYGFALILTGWVIMTILILIGVLLNVRGIYAAYDIDELNRPISLTEKAIDDAVDSYFRSTDPSELSLDGFVKTLSYHVDYGYRVPLSLVSGIMAKKKFHKKIAELTNCSYEEVMQIISIPVPADTMNTIA